MSDSKFESILWTLMSIALMICFGFCIVQCRECSAEINESHHLQIESCVTACSGNLEAAIPDNGTVVCVCGDSQ